MSLFGYENDIQRYITLTLQEPATRQYQVRSSDDQATFGPFTVSLNISRNFNGTIIPGAYTVLCQAFKTDPKKGWAEMQLDPAKPSTYPIGSDPTRTHEGHSYQLYIPSLTVIGRTGGCPLVFSFSTAVDVLHGDQRVHQELRCASSHFFIKTRSSQNPTIQMKAEWAMLGSAEVPWEQVSDWVSKIFRTPYIRGAHEPTRGLSHNDRNAIYRTLVGQPIVGVEKFEPLWNWLDHVRRLIGDFTDLWNRGFIAPLMATAEALQIFQENPHFNRPGSFLLRFSFSHPGAIVANVIKSTGKLEQVIIQERDLQQKSLYEIIATYRLFENFIKFAPSSETDQNCEWVPVDLVNKYVLCEPPRATLGNYTTLSGLHNQLPLATVPRPATPLATSQPTPSAEMPSPLYDMFAAVASDEPRGTPPAYGSTGSGFFGNR